MSNVLSAVGQFFLYSLLAVFAQNAVFSRAFGVSRLLKLVDDEATDSIIFAVLVGAVQLISAPMAYFVNIAVANFSIQGVLLSDYIRPLALVACTVVAFFIVLGLVMAVFKMHMAKTIITVLPMATFNCCVLGTLLITTTQSFTLLQTMGFALGSGLGYGMAVWLVTEGKRRLENECVPSIFRGLPITLIYIGILALAVYGFTGHMVTF